MSKIDRKKRNSQSNALAERIKKGQQRSKGYRSNIFKDNVEFEQWNPKDGEHIIDIIPYKAGKNDIITEEGQPTYTFEYQYHPVGPNKTKYICPVTYGLKCPVCERRDQLMGNDDDNYKNYWPKKRNIYNVIVQSDKGEKKKGVQIFDVAHNYLERPLMAISKKPARDGEEEKTINFVDEEEGKSICFEIQPPKSEKDFRKYIGHRFDDREYEIDSKILKQAFTLDEIVKIPTKSSYDEMKKMMNEVDEEEDNEEDNEEKNTKSNNNLIEELEDIDDIDDLVEFVKDNDIDINIDEDGSLKKQKKLVLEELYEMKKTKKLSKFDKKQKNNKEKKKSNNDIIDELDDIDDMDDLVEFVEDNDIDIEIDEDGKLKKEKKKVLNYIETLKEDEDEDEDEEEEKSNKKSNKFIDNKEFKKLEKELEDIDDMDDLVEFVEDNDIDIEIDEDGSLKKQKKLVLKELESMDDIPF